LSAASLTPGLAAANSIRAGVLSSVVGVYVLVAVFIVAVYGLLGAVRGHRAAASTWS